MDPKESPTRRRLWADIVVAFAAVYAFLAAVWAPPELFTGGAADEVRSTSLLIAAYAIGGTLGIAGLLLVNRSPMAARVAVGAGGVVLLAGLVAFRAFSLLGLASLGLSGVALLVAAPFVGPAARGDERRERMA